MKRNYAALPYDYLEEMKILTDAEFGRLCRALIVYSSTGEKVALSGNERFLYDRVLLQEQRFQEAYMLDIDKKKKSGEKGAKARWQSMAQDGTAISDIAQDGTAISQEKEGKGRENSPFLPPSSFSPKPPNLSTPYNPPKEKEKGEKETPPALFPSVTEQPPPQGGGAHVMRRNFKPPTLEEVQAYCAERGSKVDAWKFYDYFSTPDDMGRTWIDSEGKPVRNWKQKIITWEKKQRTPKSQAATGNIFLEMLAEERAKEAEK